MSNDDDRPTMKIDHDFAERARSLLGPSWRGVIRGWMREDLLRYEQHGTRSRAFDFDRPMPTPAKPPVGFRDVCRFGGPEHHGCVGWAVGYRDAAGVVDQMRVYVERRDHRDDERRAAVERAEFLYSKVGTPPSLIDTTPLTLLPYDYNQTSRSGDIDRLRLPEGWA